MATSRNRDELGITEVENLQISALKQGATPEEASLRGKLPLIEQAPQLDPTTLEGGDLPFDEIVAGNTPDQGLALDRVLEDVQPYMPDPQLKRDSLMLAAIQTASTVDPDPEALYKQALSELRESPNPDQTFENYQTQQTSEMTEDIYASALQAALTKVESPEHTADVIASLDAIKQEYSGPEGREKLFVDTLGAPEMSSQLLDHEAAYNYANKLTNDWVDTIGLFDKGVSIASLIFLPDFYKDASDLVGDNEGYTKENMLSLILGYNSATPAERMEVFPQLLEDLKVAYEDNPYKVLRVVSMLHSSEPGKEFNIGVAEDLLVIE